MDVGKAVFMTTEQEMIGWATSRPPWWKSSASAQVCWHSCVCVCVYPSVCAGVKNCNKLTDW